MKMPTVFTTLALWLGSLLATSRAEDLSSELRFPAEGILRIYDWSDELVPEERSGSHHVATGIGDIAQLVLLGENSVDTRVHVDDNKEAVDEQRAIGSGSGLGAGLGKTGQVTGFAGATNLAARTVIASQKVGSAVIATDKKATTEDKQHPIATHSLFSLFRVSLSLAFVVKALCMMCNIFYQVSPLPLITSYKAKGDTGDADLAPFIATCYGGWQWCFYGLFAYCVTAKSGFLVLVYSNFVGATLGLYYVYAFNSNCRNEAMLEKSRLYYAVLGGIVFVQACAILTQQPVRALFFSGIVSSVWSIIASGSLVSSVPTVYETRNSASLPLPLLVMGEISAALWITCGVMLKDPWITCPNTFAFAVCTFALYLCFKFPAGGCDCEADDLFDADLGPIDEDFEALGIDRTHMGRASPSPLLRALDFVSRSSASGEAHLLQEGKESKRQYGATGGTGDSW